MPNRFLLKRVAFLLIGLGVLWVIIASGPALLVLAQEPATPTICNATFLPSADSLTFDAVYNDETIARGLTFEMTQAVMGWRMIKEQAL